jgi:ABC-type nitrate/sulfonate/bicarbonate transport system permease component
MGRYRRLESFLELYMTALLAVPMISFIPLVIAFGLASIRAVWIVSLRLRHYRDQYHAGVRNVDPTLTDGAFLRRARK